MQVNIQTIWQICKFQNSRYPYVPIWSAVKDKFVFTIFCNRQKEVFRFPDYVSSSYTSHKKGMINEF